MVPRARARPPPGGSAVLACVPMEDLDAKQPKELVRILSEEEDPDPELIDALARSGPAAVPGLVEILENFVHDPSSEPNAWIAAGLLGTLKARAAIPQLLSSVRVSEGDELEWLLDALVEIGSIPSHGLFDIAFDESLSSYQRSIGIHALERCSLGEPGVRGKLVERLIVSLDAVLDGPRRIEEEVDLFAGSVMASLCRLQVESARSRIDEATRRGIGAEMVQAGDVEVAFSNPHPADDETPAPFPEAYRQLFDDEAAEWERTFRDIDRMMGKKDPSSDDTSPLEIPTSFPSSEMPQPARASKVGRNDPCPCGSGKKHKKCCLSL